MNVWGDKWLEKVDETLLKHVAIVSKTFHQPYPAIYHFLKYISTVLVLATWTPTPPPPRTVKTHSPGCRPLPPPSRTGSCTGLIKRRFHTFKCPLQQSTPRQQSTPWTVATVHPLDRCTSPPPGPLQQSTPWTVATVHPHGPLQQSTGGRRWGVGGGRFRGGGRRSTPLTVATV
jgi:hypothetical protein